MFSVPFHKQTDPAKQAGQIVNHKSDEGVKADPLGEFSLSRSGSKGYRPAHGGYPGKVQTTPEERQALKLVYPLPIPAGYTEEELERDNPYNAWMRS
jgi:hypothetical protein